MYLPAQFQETRAEVLHDFVRERPLGALVTVSSAGLNADHIPLDVDSAEMKEMLAFSAAHGIQPVIELYGMARINTVIERSRENRVRCRAVLVNNGKPWG